MTASDRFLRIAPDVRLGRNVRMDSFVNLYGCSIGDDTSLGAFVEIQKGAKIGARCRIGPHAFICEGVTVEDEATIGEGVSFTNGLIPRAATPSGRFVTDADWTALLTRVGRGAQIGANCAILCGLQIGERAVVRPGSVVTRDVAPEAVVEGVPARPVPSSSLPPGGA